MAVRRPGRRTYLALAIGVVIVVGIVVMAGPRRILTILGSVSSEPAGLDACPSGLTRIGPNACYAAPAGRRHKSIDLIVYLHGRYNAEGWREEAARQTRLADLAVKSGYAVLALRAKQGECSDPALALWWCWPSNETNQNDGPKFVDAFDAPMKDVRAKAGKQGRDLLLGFSSGAYFATLIATRELRQFDAIVIAHGGPVEPTEAQGAKVPLLLETATEDPSNGEMQKLAEELKKAEWSHEMFTRGGVHDLPTEDVNAALEFFAKTRAALPGTADAGDEYDDDDDEGGTDGGKEASAPPSRTPTPATTPSTNPDVSNGETQTGCGGSR